MHECLLFSLSTNQELYFFAIKTSEHFFLSFGAIILAFTRFTSDHARCKTIQNDEKRNYCGYSKVSNDYNLKF